MIEFKGVSKIYPGDVRALDDVSLHVKKGELVCLIGSSGSGKTTLMRTVNRMVLPTSGEVFVNGEDISKRNEVELRREIGYVVQSIGLMPHMTVYENLVTVPKLLKWSEEKMRNIAEDLIVKADLPKSYLDYYPSELSGGQQQRIGVMRALAANQEVILMDEPFGALDPITRESLQQFVRQWQKEMGKTILFVTHDMDEALKLSDRMAIMAHGKVIQYDTPENILMDPVNDFVRDMIGEDRINQGKFDYATVDTMMNTNIIMIEENSKLSDAAALMHKNRVDTLFVVDEEGKLKGHLDMFALDRRSKQSDIINDFMENSVYIYNDTIIRDVIYHIKELGYRNLPVVDREGKLLGIVTRSSVVDIIYEGLWEEYTPEVTNNELDSTGGDLL